MSALARWDIPDSWEWISIGDIGTVTGGGTPNTSDDSNFSDNGIPWLTPADLTGYTERYIGRGARDISGNGLASSSARLMPKGTVLFSSRAPIGYCAIAANPISTNQGFKSITLHGNLNPEYAYWYLRSAKDYAESEASGTTFKEISGSKMKALSFPLPPLAEQRRIVEKLDTLSAESRAATTSLTRIETLINHYKAAVLGAAFDPDRIEVASGWRVRTIAEVGDVALGRQRSPKDHQGPHMRPYIRAANITWDGLDLSNVKEMNFSPSEFEVFQLQPGDVLVNEGSGSAKEVGKPAIWRGEIKDCCFQNTTIRVRPKECTSEYLYFYFLFCARSLRFVRETQGVNIYHIGKKGLAEFPIPLPETLEDQAEIVERIEIAFAQIATLNRAVTAARAKLDSLDRTVLAKAFRGELVLQDPNDEPASELMKRLKEVS
jgi:type I restriction enzyme S subunit